MKWINSCFENGRHGCQKSSSSPRWERCLQIYLVLAYADVKNILNCTCQAISNTYQWILIQWVCALNVFPSQTKKTSPSISLSQEKIRCPCHYVHSTRPIRWSDIWFSVVLIHKFSTIYCINQKRTENTTRTMRDTDADIGVGKFLWLLWSWE